MPLPRAALRGLGRALRALGDGAAERRRVDRAVGHGHDGADLGQVRVVEHERLVLGGDAIQDAVGLGAREQAVLRIEREAGDVRLAGLVVELALAGASHAEDLALIARADVQRAIAARRRATRCTSPSGAKYSVALPFSMR